MEVPIAVNSSIKNKDELEAGDEVKPGDNTILNTIIDSRYGLNSTRQADPSEKRTQTEAEAGVDRKRAVESITNRIEETRPR